MELIQHVIHVLMDSIKTIIAVLNVQIIALHVQVIHPALLVFQVLIKMDQICVFNA